MSNVMIFEEFKYSITTIRNSFDEVINIGLAFVLWVYDR